MANIRRRPKLKLTSMMKKELEKISRSRTEKASRVERAKMLLAYAQGVTISEISRQHSTNRPKVERSIDKDLQLGALTALDDLPRSGKPPAIIPEDKAWRVSSTCQTHKDLGYNYE